MLRVVKRQKMLFMLSSLFSCFHRATFFKHMKKKNTWATGKRNYLEQVCAAQGCSDRSIGNRAHTNPEKSKDTVMYVVLVWCYFLTAGVPVHDILQPTQRSCDWKFLPCVAQSLLCRPLTKSFKKRFWLWFILLALPHAYTGSLSQSHSKPLNSSPMAAQEGGDCTKQQTD